MNTEEKKRWVKFRQLKAKQLNTLKAQTEKLMIEMFWNQEKVYILPYWAIVLKDAHLWLEDNDEMMKRITDYSVETMLTLWKRMIDAIYH